jgi:two-component system, cell cycle sensor histidine kinase and response regulator CckA
MNKILVVDDNQQNLYMLQVLLSANGFQVEQASNGAEALEYARRALPDMIVSDILMPVMDGYALCRTWKEDERLKNIPFIFYTATYTEPKDEEFALKLGADRFIIKPAEPDKFLAIILEAEKNVKVSNHVPSSQNIEPAEYYQEYNAALIRKLEAKMLQLEESNRILEHDITDRKQVEEALRESEKKFRNYIEMSPDGVFVVDYTGRYLDANKSACRITGFSKEEIEKMSIRDLVAEESVEDGAAHFKKLVETGSATSDLWHKHKDGSKRCLTVNAVKLSEERILGFCTDITERKEAEEKQKKLEDQLRQSQKLEAIVSYPAASPMILIIYWVV